MIDLMTPFQPELHLEVMCFCFVLIHQSREKGGEVAGIIRPVIASHARLPLLREGGCLHRSPEPFSHMAQVEGLSRTPPGTGPWESVLCNPYFLQIYYLALSFTPLKLLGE